MVVVEMINAYSLLSNIVIYSVFKYVCIDAVCQKLSTSVYHENIYQLSVFVFSLCLFFSVVPYHNFALLCIDV